MHRVPSAVALLQLQKGINVRDWEGAIDRLKNNFKRKRVTSGSILKPLPPSSSHHETTPVPYKSYES